MPEGGGKLEEIYRLTKENNQMLRAMRRSAWLHGVFKVVMYLAIVGIGLWAYMTFLAPLLIQMLDTLEKIQGASNQAQGQFSGLMDSLNSLKAWLPGASSTTTQ
jgi:hypothetical protein